MIITRMDHEQQQRNHGGTTTLTEIQKLLHGQRRGGELGEVVDVLWHVGLSHRLHHRANEPNFTRHPQSGQRNL